jgi:hypothetical protein
MGLCWEFQNSTLYAKRSADRGLAGIWPLYNIFSSIFCRSEKCTGGGPLYLSGQLLNQPRQTAGLRRKSGVGAAISQHQYRTLSEETHPKAHPVRSGDCHLVNVARGTHLVQFLQHINCMKVRGIELHSLSVILNRQHCVPARLICLTEAIERI